MAVAHRANPAHIVPKDLREQTLFDWVAVEKMFIAPYGRVFSQTKVNGLRKSFDFNAVGVLYLSFRDKEDMYAVLDGQHRKVAAEQEGYTMLPARIFLDLTYEQEAGLYVRFATVNKQMAVDRMRARLEARDPKALAIRAIVQERGMDVACALADSSKPRFIAAVYELEKVYDQHGGELLTEVCRTLQAAWDDQSRAWSCYLLSGTAAFLARYHGNPLFRYERLITRMRLLSPETILARATMNSKTLQLSKGALVGMALLEIYNDGLRSGKLPAWQSFVISAAGLENLRISGKANLPALLAAQRVMQGRRALLAAPMPS